MHADTARIAASGGIGHLGIIAPWAIPRSGSLVTELAGLSQITAGLLSLTDVAQTSLLIEGAQ